MRINQKLKNRLRRLVLDAKAGLKVENPGNLKVYITEFNEILTELKQQGIKINIVPFTYTSGQDESLYGGISYTGIAKIQDIITKSQNILDEKVEGEKRSGQIWWRGFLGVLFSGLMIFLFNFFYSLGIKHTEKKYDEEKIKLYDQNVELKRKLDSCMYLKDAHIETGNALKIK